jgi:hypothetical protein
MGLARTTWIVRRSISRETSPMPRKSPIMAAESEIPERPTSAMIFSLSPTVSSPRTRAEAMSPAANRNRR